MRSLLRERVIANAKAVAKARAKVGPSGAALDSVWDDIERKERKMLRSIERMAGLARGALGTRDSS